jgi:hypothetical protein
MAFVPGLYTYSFQYFNATIVGLGGIGIALADGSGAAEGGISFNFKQDKNHQTGGADGSVMNTQIQLNMGEATARFMQTSPINAQLDQMYQQQVVSGIGWGANVISGFDSSSGSTVKATGVAFKRQPGLVYAMNGAVLEWQFDIAQLYIVRGAGVLGTLGTAVP